MEMYLLIFLREKESFDVSCNTSSAEVASGINLVTSADNNLSNCLSG